MTYTCYSPPTKLQEGNVFAGVCLSVHEGGHVTITHDALDLTYSPPRHGTPCPPLLVTSGGHHRRPIQTCPLEDPLSVLTFGGGHRSTHAWQAGTSYWNAFFGSQRPPLYSEQFPLYRFTYYTNTSTGCDLIFDS